MKLLLPLLLFLVTACAPKPLVKNDDNTKIYNQKKVVQEFIEIIENDDKIKLSQNTIYPLKRRHPLSDLVDDVAIIDRYDQIFDEEIKQRIINSDPLKDWEEVGSKGIMFLTGQVWLDFNGRLFAVNHQSEEEKKIEATNMKKKKNLLHESVRNYEKPVLEMTTTSYQIRIDDLGSYNYRYASWPKHESLLTKPEIILTGAETFLEGNSGGKRLIFTNGTYKYEVVIIKMGPLDGPLGRLNVYNGAQKILSEDAITYID